MKKSLPEQGAERLFRKRGKKRLDALENRFKKRDEPIEGRENLFLFHYKIAGIALAVVVGVGS